jgi:hypothetical protein
MEQFDDVDVSAFAVDRAEQLGTKPKQWLRDQDDRRWLYKWLSPEQAARHRGEDWAEKVVGEIGRLLGVPCARIELAHRGGTRGIISLDVVSDDLDLVHGNELLAGRVAGYPVSDLRNIAAYRVDTIVEVLAGMEPSTASGRSAVDDFAGYLMLDALVANTDRHHQNWAVLVPQRGSRSAALAPTFDHASSLACGLTDDARVQRLQTRDAGFGVPAFARRAPSHFADAPTLAEAVGRIGALVPQAVAPWASRLARVSVEELIAPCWQVPPERMSARARDFAAALLRENYVHLRELLEDLR